ncbi:MAG: hypothetical protein GY703_09820 [Gammaproteobacteria bacterium]|nr:hypothetical protein [Gammaproteobacteria bacterium]
MAKFWLIAVFIFAGGLYYWFGDEQAAQTTSKPDRPIKDRYTGHPVPTASSAPQGMSIHRSADPFRNGIPRQHRESPYPSGHPAYGGISPGSPRYHFRPLDTQALARRKPPSPNRYGFPSTRQNQTEFPSPDSLSAYGVGNTPDWSVYPQGKPAPGYKFRPDDAGNRVERWIGNYPKFPGAEPTAPLRHYTPEPKANYAFIW